MTKTKSRQVAIGICRKCLIDGLAHGQWTRDESFFQNIPNVLADWADRPNTFLDIWVFSAELSALILEL